jgi:hypothetical protein
LRACSVAFASGAVLGNCDVKIVVKAGAELEKQAEVHEYELLVFEGALRLLQECIDCCDGVIKSLIEIVYVFHLLPFL